MHSLAFMEIIFIIFSILTPLVLLNIIIYIVKKEIIKTTLRRSLKVFLIAISIVLVLGVILNLYYANQPKTNPTIEFYKK
jgi:heme A synthase